MQKRAPGICVAGTPLRMLAALPARQLPLHAPLDSRLPASLAPLAAVKQMRVDYHRLADDYDRINRFLRDTFST